MNKQKSALNFFFVWATDGVFLDGVFGSLPDPPVKMNKNEFLRTTICRDCKWAYIRTNLYSDYDKCNAVHFVRLKKVIIDIFWYFFTPLWVIVNFLAQKFCTRVVQGLIILRTVEFAKNITRDWIIGCVMGRKDVDERLPSSIKLETVLYSSFCRVFMELSL